MIRVLIQFLLLGLITISCGVGNNRWNKELYLLQKNRNNRYAISAFNLRKIIVEKFNQYKADTLFLIERVDEVSLLVEGAIWNSKRNTTFLYENIYKSNKFYIDSQTVEYDVWVDPLTIKTELFDTLFLSKQKLFGGSRTFLSRITKSEETFFFEDMSLGYPIKMNN